MFAFFFSTSVMRENRTTDWHKIFTTFVVLYCFRIITVFHNLSFLCTVSDRYTPPSTKSTSAGIFYLRRGFPLTNLLVGSEPTTNQWWDSNPRALALRNFTGYLSSSFEVGLCHNLWPLGHIGQTQIIGLEPIRRFHGY